MSGLLVRCLATWCDVLQIVNQTLSSRLLIMFCPADAVPSLPRPTLSLIMPSPRSLTL